MTQLTITVMCVLMARAGSSLGVACSAAASLAGSGISPDVLGRGGVHVCIRVARTILVVVRHNIFAYNFASLVPIRYITFSKHTIITVIPQWIDTNLKATVEQPLRFSKKEPESNGLTTVFMIILRLYNVQATEMKLKNNRYTIALVQEQRLLHGCFSVV